MIRISDSRAALFAAVSTMAFCVASVAHGEQAAQAPAVPQAAAAPAVDGSPSTDIVVTGYSASLQSALNAKRLSNLPIESITPEDVGKLPDQNVAESLQRLPGIQINRTGGRGTAVLIDGLRQNLTTLNGDIFLTGKEFYVSGEAAGGGNGGNSQYNSLEGIPSEEIGGIDVYKNPQASITEGGLGGTINLKTRDPLKQSEGFSLGGNARASTGQRDGSWTPNGTLVASYKFNDRFAVTASVSYDSENTHTLEFQNQNRNQWLITDSATGPYVGPLQPAGLTHLGKNYIEPQLDYFTDRYDRFRTLGASFGAAYKLSDSLTTSFVWFHSHEKETTIDYTNKVWFNGQGTSPGNLLPGIDPSMPYSIDSHGVVQSATVNANGAETATLWQGVTTNTNNFQLVTKYDNDGPFKASLDGAYSRANSTLQAAQADVEHGLYTNFAGNATSPTAPGCNNGASTCTTGNHGYEFVYANGGTSGLPSVKYLAPYADVLSNPNYTTFKSNWAWSNRAKQEQWSIKGDAQYEPDFLKTAGIVLSGGFRIASRKVDETFGRYLINGVTAAGAPIGNCCNDPNGGTYLYYLDPGYASIPYSTALSNPGLAKTVTNFATGQIIVKDPVTGGQTDPSTYLNKVWNGGSNPASTNNSEKFFVDGLSSFRVSEKTYSGYLMADIGGKEDRYHANFGVRLVNTQLTVDNGQTAAVPTYYGTASWNGVDSNVVPVETKRNYIDILPTFNFVLDVSDTQKIRVGAARVVAPQDLYSLGLGNSYNFTRQTNARTNVHTGLKDGFAFAGGGSGNADLDPYRATQFNASYEDYFSRGGLLSVAGFYKQVDNFVETQNIATNVLDDFGGTVSNVSKPVNAGKGKIYGIELGAQYAFNEPGSWLNGLGFAANYTRSESTSDQTTSFSAHSPIPGIAKNSFNLTGYYEHSGFSIRASYSWRDKSVNDSLVGSTFAFPDQSGVSQVYQVYQASYGQLDGQIAYDITRRIGVVVQVQNLTESV